MKVSSDVCPSRALAAAADGGGELSESPPLSPLLAEREKSFDLVPAVSHVCMYVCMYVCIPAVSVETMVRQARERRTRVKEAKVEGGEGEGSDGEGDEGEAY